MTTEEFSNEFDVLIDSYSRFKKFDDKEQFDSIEFNEYEKSVFLTRAQEELVKAYYNGGGSAYSFEFNEETRRYLSSLVKTVELTNLAENLIGLSDYSRFYQLPDDCWFITYEAVKIKNAGCMTGKRIVVYPTTQDAYTRIYANPFRTANNRRALRLDIEDNKVEIISTYDVDKYLLRYLAQPKPIILEDLPETLSINDVQERTECELSPVVHKLILQAAVQMALQSKSIHGSKS